MCDRTRITPVVPLQSATPSLGPPTVFLVILVVAGAGFGAVGSAVARRLSNPVGKYRLLYLGVLAPFALLSYGLLALLEFGSAVAAATVGTTGPLGSLVADVTGLLGAGIVWLAAYAPTISGVRAVRDIDLSTTTAVVRMARYVVGVSVAVAVVMLPLRLGPGVSPLGLTGVLATLILVGVGASPWVVAALRSTTAPSESVRDRLATLRDRAGLDVRDTLVLDTDDEETAAVYVRGPPGYRRLFVTSTFLDRFDDETAVALLAVQAGRVRTHLLVRRVGTAVLAAVPLVAAVTGWGPRWPLLGAAVGVVLVGFWLTRRGVRGADEVAAETVGSDAVADAFERYAEVHALEPSRRRVPNPLSVTVPLGDRIDRLRGLQG